MNRLEELIQSVTGLNPASLGSGHIERAVNQRMAHCGATTAAAYLRIVKGDEAELKALIALTTVPETWFFRDPAAFRPVVERALRHAGEAPYRILSLPCSSGEEPYSVAIALLEAGVRPGSFRIEGADICETAIEQARRGLYGKNSFRSDDLGFRDRYFRKREAGFEMLPLLREQVQFRTANLLRWTCAAPGPQYEAILCRNLLIYFDSDTQARAVSILRRMLLPGGVICVAPAEAAVLIRSDFAPLGQPGAFMMRPEEKSGPVKKPAPMQCGLAGPVGAAPIVSPARPRPPAPEPAVAANPAGQLSEAALLAGSGRYSEADSICREMAARGAATAEMYYLQAVAAEAAGKLGDAAAYYRKAIYLDPKHAEALLQFSLLTARMGDAEAAQTLRERARRASLGSRKEADP